MRKTGLEIQTEILRQLATQECSLRELETRLNTNFNTVRAHVKILEFYGVAEQISHERSDANGRPYTTVRLTERGIRLLKERGLTAKR